MANSRSASICGVDKETKGTEIWMAIVSSLFILIIFTEIDSCSGAASNSYCMTNQCKRAADDLLQDMNPSKDPCDAFYEFACGKWSDNLSK